MIHGNNYHKKAGSDWISENEDPYEKLNGFVKLLFTLQNDKNILNSVKSLLEVVETQNNDKHFFKVGDHVKIAVTKSQLREKQAVVNLRWNPFICDAIGEIGNVVSVDKTGQIYVKFEKCNEKWALNSDVLEKLNRFSMGQIVRILSNERTIKALQTKLGNRMTHLMVGQVGCVSKLNDEQNVSLEWLDTSLPMLSAPVQSDWLESLLVSESQFYETLFQMRWKLTDHFVEVANKGDLYLVQLLVQNYKVPVDVQHRSTPGLTALHVACLEGRLNVVQWFLSEQKNKDLLLEKEDYKGRRAIYFAVKGCQSETLNMLIKNGADVDPQTSISGRKSPLHKAVEKMNLECVIILIENYCNVNLQDSEGNTPLHYSVLDNSNEILDDVFKALVKSERIDFNIRNVKGRTVFHSAVLTGNLSAVSSLLKMEKGEISLGRVTDTGSNALHLACTKGHLKVGQLLLEKKELINERNMNGQTPLMVACWKGFSPMIELLVKAGADVNAMDENCHSAISFMTRRIYLDDRHYELKIKATILFPSTEKSPETHKIYDELSGLPCYKETMEKHPSIASVCYLVKHGGDLESGRYWISKVRDANVQVILDGFSSEWQMSVDEEKIIANCILCNKAALRMRFVCCGNESCLFCFVCRTKNVRRCPCCNTSIKPNGGPFPIIALDDDETIEENDDSDSSFDHHQSSEVNNDNLLHFIKSSESAVSERPADIPITTIEKPYIPVTYISSPLPSISVKPLNPNWILRKGASRKGTDLLEDGLGNYYTRRSAKVWQCTRQSNIQKNKCPATVRDVGGGQYILGKNHRHSTQSTIIARSYSDTHQVLN